MNFLVINLYELGQFLRILLWIFLPVFVLAALITTYIHYRKRRKGSDAEGYLAGFALSAPIVLPATAMGEDTEFGPETPTGAYKGFLWLKGKYEQDREMATSKYLQLKEEYRMLKEKFDDLKAQIPSTPAPLAATPSPLTIAGSKPGPGPEDEPGMEPTPPADTPAPSPTREEIIELAACKDQLAQKNLQLAFLQNQLDQRINNFHELEQRDREHIERITEFEARHQAEQGLLNERQATIQRLQAELEQEIARAKEVKDKLESGGQLLSKLHGELDQLLTTGHNGILAAV